MESLQATKYIVGASKTLTHEVGHFQALQVAVEDACMSLYQALYVFIGHDVDGERTSLLMEKGFHCILESLANIFAWQTNVFTSPQTKQTFCKFRINIIHVRIRKQLFW